MKTKSKTPEYMRLYTKLREGIVGGAYQYKSRLPSKRVLAEKECVSTVTVEHAYEMLCDEGYAESRERSGYYVSFLPSDSFSKSRPPALPFSPPAPPAESAKPSSSAESAESAKSAENSDYSDSIPYSVLAKTMRRVISEKGEAILERSPNSGTYALRRALAGYLARGRGIKVEAEQIIIGSGSEYLYGLALELLGRTLTYAVEYPSYKKIEQVYKASEVKCELLPLGGDGIESAFLRASNADVLHITPYRSYPSGVTATASKRHEYLSWASADGRYIIEDDFESEFSISRKPEDTLFSLSPRGNVIYMNTFSKTLSPALRVGYMVLPIELASRFAEKLGFYSCTVPTFEQLVITELIENGDFERHINRVRRNKRRRAAPFAAKPAGK